MKKKNKNQKIRRPLYPELIANILSRLPAECLLKWRLVSKQWRSLVDNETPRPLAFVFLHQVNRLPMSFIAARMTHKGNLTRRFIAFHHGPSSQFPNTDIPSYIIASCNGLFLYRTAKPLYKVCNPATKTWVFLPDPPCTHWMGYPSHVALLAYDPRNSPDYKVLLLFSRRIFTIYSSVDNTWRQHSPFPVEIYEYSCHQIKFYGYSGCHRMSLFLNGIFYLYNHNNIVRFDLTGERYRVLRLPSGVGERMQGSFLFGLLGGYVCCAKLEGLGLKVWMLEEEEENWVLKHINNEAMTCKKGPSILAFHPELYVILVRNSSLLSFYDIKHKKLEHLISLSISGERMIAHGCSDSGYNPALLSTVLPFSPCFLDTLEGTRSQGVSV